MNANFNRTSGIVLFLLVFWLPCLAGAAGQPEDPGLLSGIRQLTFVGRRAGEGYFSPDGRSMIFQSERTPGNPFFQIYLMDLGSGETRRLSPGTGRTTCSWLHPGMGKAMFSSTHLDPLALEKQAEVLHNRAEAPEGRHNWVYDEHYDIFEVDLETGALVNLTRARGYDAEGSYSPSGDAILFASNRHAYSETLSAADRELFERDPGAMLDLYIMKSDGTDVRRLTRSRGQDGGPFFSADGTKLVWRRFEVDAPKAEIFTMNRDGTGERRITRLGAMSWAPFFHPSGAYIIFATNRHGFDNFELYIVDAEGKHEPVRATVLPGFDGLPAFTPDGRHLAWTSNRTPNRKGQIFMADWDHDRALGLLGLADKTTAGKPPHAAALPALPRRLDPAIRAEDFHRHVRRLADPALGGRLTGTPGARKATAYVAGVFEQIGLAPAGENGTYFQEFSFVSGVEPGPDNRLILHGCADGPAPVFDRDWRPLAHAATKKVARAPVAFAGYGIVAPADGEHPAYDAYGELEVEGKWVIVFRYLPEDVSQQRRLHLSRFSSLREKTRVARERGAVGLVVVSGPRSGVRRELVPLVLDGPPGGSIAAVTVTDALAARLLAPGGRMIEKLQAACDKPEPPAGFALDGVELGARIDLVTQKGTGRNVLGLLPAAGVGSPGQVIMVGAHVDHIGRGEGLNSLARRNEQGEVHPGADDNASGVAGMLEIAAWLAHREATGELRPQRGVLFAAWSGEELGLLGSGHFVKGMAQSATGPDPGLHPRIGAYLNMDMIGRLRGELVLYGLGSSPAWAGLIERHNAPLALPVVVQEDSFLPTDATSFALQKVPVLSAFTGLHDAYNTPRDTADSLDYPGASRVAKLLGRIAADLAARDKVPEYRPPKKKPPRSMQGHGGRVYLGTVPDFSDTDVTGVRLSGARPGGPAAEAGIRAGDVIVEVAGHEIENLYDYAHALRALKVGEPASIVIEREGERLELEVTPGSRE